MGKEFEENVYLLIKGIGDFVYSIESRDCFWNMIFPDQKEKYHSIRIIKSDEVFYIADMDGPLCTLEVTLNKSVQAAPSFGHSFHNDYSHDPARGWNRLILDACKWLKVVKKDWIKANRQVHESYPLNRRYGVVSNSLIRASLSDYYRIDKELGKMKMKKFISLVESSYFYEEKKTKRESMTANDFFDYCKIAYIAGKRTDDHVDEKLSGREMYQRYADGRDEGLLEIDPESMEEFADWIDDKHPKKSRGGHPWEIKRGGNTTHIDLSVTRPFHYRKEGFQVCLGGASIGRLRETICMFLAICDAGLPITISDPIGIRKRLLAQDNIGIIPSHDSLHRANQHFHEHEDVYDVIHYDGLGRYKLRIKPFITWEPLSIFQPIGSF